MAYFVNKNTRFILEVQKALENHFGKNTTSWKNNRITVKINEGFDDEIDRLTDEELEIGIIGGGYKKGINNEEFVLEVI